MLPPPRVPPAPIVSLIYSILIPLVLAFRLPHIPPFLSPLPPPSSLQHVALSRVSATQRFLARYGRNLITASFDSNSNASLPNSQGFWGRFKTPKVNKDAERQAHLALSRQRLLTLVFDDMETIKIASTLPSISP